MAKTSLPKIGFCGVCSSQASEDSFDEHHRVPRNAGGGDEASNLIQVCQSCHQFIHRIVHLLRKGDTQRIAHLLNSNYQDKPKKVHDLLVDLAATAMKEEDAHVRTDESEVNIPLKLLLPVYTKLRELAVGSHCSMEKVIIELIEKECRTRKFGGNPPAGLQRLR